MVVENYYAKLNLFDDLVPDMRINILSKLNYSYDLFIPTKNLMTSFPKMKALLQKLVFFHFSAPSIKH